MEMARFKCGCKVGDIPVGLKSETRRAAQQRPGMLMPLYPAKTEKKAGPIER